MRINEIENWARTIIARVKDGQSVEDHRVELKADWPDPRDAARRIAGHGNATHGEAILWLIGVDEKRGVTGASLVDVASWYPQVESQFDDHAPGMRSVNFSVDGGAVVALLFETERAPFVVKNPHGGYPEFSVPWRAGTRLRAARRDELLRILSPLHQLPSLDVVGAALEVGTPSGTRSQVWGAAIKVFVTPKNGSRLVVPFHRCKGELTFMPHQNFKHPFLEIKIRPFSGHSGTIFTTETEALIDGPGMFLLSAELMLPDNGWKPGGAANVKFDLYLAAMEQYVVINETMPICLLNPYRWERGESLAVFDKARFVVVS
ncbi:MAG TPA: hypothetical protein VF525_16540 [Pyrinomonadaceae bacterium]|jgi:hypothetical protein